MNVIVKVKKFNKLLDNFLDFLNGSFKEYRADLFLAKSTLDTARRSNPMLVVEVFMQSLGPFKTQINNCDEDFFLNTIEFNGNDFLSSTKIKQIWTSKKITDTQKAMIFYYFQKLLEVGTDFLCC